MDASKKKTTGGLTRPEVFITIFISGVTSYLIYSYLPVAIPDVNATSDKLIFALRWQCVSLLTLIIGVQIVAFTRLFTPAINPLDRNGEQYVNAYQRCLQNTLEQLVLNVPGQLILATFLESASLRVIPVLVFLFVVGRIFYWIGYPNKRAFGFGLTILPNAAICVANVYFLFTTGASFGIGKLHV